jgi:hypothetical protein
MATGMSGGITTWMLILFLGYSNGAAEEGGSVAMTSEKVDFFSIEECREARKDFYAEAARVGYKRPLALCMKRSSALLSK